MIYTRFFTPVKITAVKAEWIDSPARKGEQFPVWWVKAEVHPDIPEADRAAHGQPGRPVLDREWFGADQLKADGGWGEIDDACAALAGHGLMDTPYSKPTYSPKTHMDELGAWLGI